MTTRSEAPIELIRKCAGALAVEELGTPDYLRPLDTEDIIFYEKVKSASIDDIELLKIATDLCIMDGTNNVLEIYEAMGGKYKHAFGSPMFSGQQMAGSPAVSGGMASRASTPMPMAQQAQPTKSPATASPRAQAAGMTNSSSATAQTPAPSAAPVAAPTTTVSVG